MTAMTRMRWGLALVAAVALMAGCAPVAGAGSGSSPDPSATEGFGLVPDVEPASTDPDAPLVGFYGDSYTLGTGASAREKRWSTIVCQKRGWNEFNPSVNGLGFVNNRRDLDLPQLIIDQRPDIVIVTMGLNDNFSYARVPDRQIRDAIAGDLARLAATGARIVVVEPFWYTDRRPESVEVIIGWVHDEADAVGADWISGASRWLEGHPEWMASDGLHPNDAGYAQLATHMDAELTALGL
jgi:lysophospholipase L1-like esterase